MKKKFDGCDFLRILNFFNYVAMIILPAFIITIMEDFDAVTLFIIVILELILLETTCILSMKITEHDALIKICNILEKNIDKTYNPSQKNLSKLKQKLNEIEENSKRKNLQYKINAHKICNKCLKEIKSDWIYCNYCGEKLKIKE